PVAVLLFDAMVLSLSFFLQHSLMARPAVQEKLASHLPRPSLTAVYSTASGIALLAVLLLWQRAFPGLIEVPPPLSWALRVLFFASLAFAAWAGRTLGGLDALGIKPILAEMNMAEPPDEPPLVTKGPYRLVRHPMYSATLVLIWSCPDVSGDRLLFNVLWSVWIVAAAKLEEKELTARYGAAYRTYRKRVPGLLPWPRP
ncbi:MAG: methyltransferase family protein, partial [Desulfohalobiaceae bacterium]